MRTPAAGMASPLGGLAFIRSELRRGRSRRVRGLEWYSTERGLGLVSSRGFYSMPEAGVEPASGARTSTGCSGLAGRGAMDAAGLSVCRRRLGAGRFVAGAAGLGVQRRGARGVGLDAGAVGVVIGEVEAAERLAQAAPALEERERGGGVTVGALAVEIHRAEIEAPEGVAAVAALPREGDRTAPIRRHAAAVRVLRAEERTGAGGCSCGVLVVRMGGHAIAHPGEELHGAAGILLDALALRILSGGRPP